MGVKAARIVRRCLVALLLVVAPAGATAALAEPLTLVALGDSLTAGYGLAPGEAFPEQPQAALRARGHDVGSEACRGGKEG